MTTEKQTTADDNLTEEEQAIANRVSDLWAEVEDDPDVRESATVLLSAMKLQSWASSSVQTALAAKLEKSDSFSADTSEKDIQMVLGAIIGGLTQSAMKGFEMGALFEALATEVHPWMLKQLSAGQGDLPSRDEVMSKRKAVPVTLPKAVIPEATDHGYNLVAKTSKPRVLAVRGETEAVIATMNWLQAAFESGSLEVEQLVRYGYRAQKQFRPDLLTVEPNDWKAALATPAEHAALIQSQVLPKSSNLVDVLLVDSLSWGVAGVQLTVDTASQQAPEKFQAALAHLISISELLATLVVVGVSDSLPGEEMLHSLGVVSLSAAIEDTDFGRMLHVSGEVVSEVKETSEELQLQAVLR